MNQRSIHNDDSNWWIFRGGNGPTFEDRDRIQFVRIEIPFDTTTTTTTTVAGEHNNNKNNHLDIPDNCFQNCKNLKFVIFPHCGLRKIGRNAFRNCVQLTTVEWIRVEDDDQKNNEASCSTLLTTLGDYAFYGCSRLSKFDLPNSVTTIGHFCFCKCSSLTFMSFPNNDDSSTKPNLDETRVITMGDGILEGCSNLKGTKLPMNLTFIPQSTFMGCTLLEAVDIPNSVRWIGDYAFHSCKTLRKLSLPRQLTSLSGVQSFYGCSRLQSFQIPENVAEPLGEDTLAGCEELRSLQLPIKIHPNFGLCENLFNEQCSSLSIVDIPALRIAVWPILLEKFGNHQLFEKPRLFQRTGMNEKNRKTCIFSFLQQNIGQIFANKIVSEDNKPQSCVPNPFASPRSATSVEMGLPNDAMGLPDEKPIVTIGMTEPTSLLRDKNLFTFGVTETTNTGTKTRASKCKAWTKTAYNNQKRNASPVNPPFILSASFDSKTTVQDMFDNKDGSVKTLFSFGGNSGEKAESPTNESTLDTSKTKTAQKRAQTKIPMYALNSQTMLAVGVAAAAAAASSSSSSSSRRGNDQREDGD